MKVLIADKLAGSCVNLLEQAGISIIVEPGATGDDLVSSLKAHSPTVLVVRSTLVPADAIDACPGLELIVRAGAGYDNIDVAAASARGVFVANCPGKNAIAVAELAMGLILALDRQIPDNVMQARAGRWNKAAFSKGRGLKDRRLGLIGVGNVGTAVAQRALAFDMRVAAWSRSLTDEKAAALDIMRFTDRLMVAEESDIVSVHLASTPDTAGMIGRKFFERMREGALFINTARAEVVEEDALKWAMEEKGIRAAIDVMQGEPGYKSGEFAHELSAHDSLYITHHIGASTDQAQDAVANEAVRVIITYARTGDVLHCVNMEEHSPATRQITVRHLDKVGVLAAVLKSLSEAGCNVQEMENLVFAGAHAACAVIRYHGPAAEGLEEMIAAHPDVLAVSTISV